MSDDRYIKLLSGERKDVVVSKVIFEVYDKSLVYLTSFSFLNKTEKTFSIVDTSSLKSVAMLYFAESMGESEMKKSVKKHPMVVSVNYTFEEDKKSSTHRTFKFMSLPEGHL